MGRCRLGQGEGALAISVSQLIPFRRLEDRTRRFPRLVEPFSPKAPSLPGSLRRECVQGKHPALRQTARP